MTGLPRLSLCGSSNQNQNPDPASARLFADHRRLVSKVVRSAAHKWPAIPHDDFRQAALVALWRADRAYDPCRGVPFASYAAVCMKNSCQELAAREHCQQPATVASLDAMLDLDQDHQGNQNGSSHASPAIPRTLRAPDDTYVRCLLADIARMVAGFQHKMRAVYFDHVVGGQSQCAVARRLGISQQRVAALKSDLYERILEVLTDQK